MKLIDLHIHSTASDGSLTPTEVVNRANDLGLTAMALTDHDTVAGIDEALEAAKDLDMEVIPGIEVSCIYKGKEIHILGLYIDHKDPELLSLVWNNLFSNAIKFTDPGGSVSLRLKSEGAYAVIGVSDTGCGISQEAGKHIFEKFYQGDTSHATKGNGLGLALVKRVIDIAGGDIWVSSEIGKGSTFTVKLRRETGGKT